MRPLAERATNVTFAMQTLRFGKSVDDVQHAVELDRDGALPRFASQALDECHQFGAQVPETLRHDLGVDDHRLFADQLCGLRIEPGALDRRPVAILVGTSALKRWP